MNAPLRNISLDWRMCSEEGRLCLDDRRAMTLVARLAATLLNPVNFPQGLGASFDRIAGPSLSRFAAHPHFGPALRRAFACDSGFGALSFDLALFDRLTTTPSTRLCLLLVCEPLELIRKLAMDLAAAILQRRVLCIVMKAPRAKLRAALGEDALRLGSQEAPMMYPALADLAPKEMFDSGLMEQSEADLRKQVGAVGLAALFATVGFCEPQLLPILTRRVGAIPPGAKGFAEEHRDQISKFVRRRMPAWSAIIG